MRTKLRQFSTLREAFEADRKHAREQGLDPIVIMAERCSCSEALVYKWLELVKPMPLLAVRTWSEACGSDHAQRWLLNDWGYDAIKRRDTGYTTHDLMTDLPAAIERCSAVFGATAEALRDQKITPDELRLITSRAGKAIKSLSQIVESAEAALINDGRIVDARERF